MSTNAYRGLMQLVTAVEQNFNILNSNPNPQVVLDAWGTEAAQLFTDYENAVAYLEQHLPSWTPPTTTNTYTIKQDGTVTWNQN